MTQMFYVPPQLTFQAPSVGCIVLPENPICPEHPDDDIELFRPSTGDCFTSNLSPSDFSKGSDPTLIHDEHEDGFERSPCG